MLSRLTLFLAISLSMSACATSGTIPSDLTEIEGLAEDAYDKALVSDYSTVSTDATAIQEYWTAFREQATSDGASQNDIAALDSAIPGLSDAAAAAESPVSVARAANTISASMDELYALYSPSVPTEILVLDYLGREVVLDGMEADLTAAGADTDTIQSTWDSVRARVIEAGGEKEAQDYDANITAIRDAISAGNADEVVNQANAGLELVDTIEQVFGG
jgi:hypothetical protein